MVLKNLPSDLTKSDLRKDFLQKMCGRECSKIVEVQPRKDNWPVVTASKADAETLVGVFQNGDKSLPATIRSPSHLGIARFVPSNINDDELCALIPKCVSSRQIGNTRSFRLKFETKVIYPVAAKMKLFAQSAVTMVIQAPKHLLVKGPRSVHCANHRIIPVTASNVQSPKDF